MQAYYRTIRASLAVVPAFASDVYFTKKSSSSVAAAMVCGTPVLADHDLVRHYNYLSKVSPHPTHCLTSVLYSLAAGHHARFWSAWPGTVCAR